MKHCGKTHHGASLAATLGRAFVDLDSLIQEIDAEGGDSRRPVREIYRNDGEERFRQLEAEACRRVASEQRDLVVATGGGICDNEAALETISGGVCVYVSDTLSRLTERVLASGIPAFLETEDLAEARDRFARMYRRRTAIYSRIATVTVKVDRLGLDEAERRVVASVKEFLDGGQ